MLFACRKAIPLHDLTSLTSQSAIVIEIVLAVQVLKAMAR